MLKLILPIAIMIMSKSQQASIMPLSVILVAFNLNMQKPEVTKISYIFMGDELSFWTTSLAVWLTFILTFMKTNHPKYYSTLLFLMLSVLMITFYTWNFMMFYLMFEVSMIIVLIIIMTWGYQPERVEAIIFMIVMTVMVSLPFLTSMMNNMNNLNFWLTTKITLTEWEYLSFMAVFMMKMPTMFLHMWLTKVHVESPIQGSMILASILLKLGSYGLVRTTHMNSWMNTKMMPYLIAFGMWSTVIMSITCLVQTDLKTIIAYSSVVHMTLVFSAIVLNNCKSMMGAICIMLGHGMCSSGLFYLANFLYKNSKSRSVISNKGIMTSMPLSSALWFVLCMSNAPMPPSINILGEFMSFKSIVNWSSISLFMMFIVVFTSSLYSIYLFYLPTHGNFTKLQLKINPLSNKSLNLTMLHILPTLTLMIKPQLMMI